MSQLTRLLSELKPIRTTLAPAEMAPRLQPTSSVWSTHDCCASTQHGSVSACSIVTVATATTACFDDDAYDECCQTLSETLCDPTLWQSVRCQEAQSHQAKSSQLGSQEQGPAVLRCAVVAGGTSVAVVDRSAPSASTRQTSQCGVSTRQTSQCGANSPCRPPASDWSDSYIDVAIDHACISIASPSPAVAATACRTGAVQHPALGSGVAGCAGGRRVASTGLFHAQPSQQQPQPHTQQQQAHHRHPMQLPALYGLCPQPQLHRHTYLHTYHPATATTDTSSRISAVRRLHTRTDISSPIPVPSPLPGLTQQRPRPSAEPFIDRAEDDAVVLQQRRQRQQELQEQQRQRLLIEEEADLLLLELEQQEREEQQQKQQKQKQAAKPVPERAPRDWRENKMLLAVMGYYNAHRHER